MIKIKLLPSLKEKKRYLLYEGNVSSKIIKQELKLFLGDLNLAKAGLMFITKKGNKGILRMNVKYVDQIKAGLMLIKPKVTTLKTSGTLKKLKSLLNGGK